MNRYVSLLRGINVGGQKKIGMELLRGIYEDLGFTHVHTYLQSGNVVFESQEQDEAGLVQCIEEQIEQVCGYHVSTLIRQAPELQKILAENPFILVKNEDPAKLYVSFLYQRPSAASWSGLTPLKDTTDEFSPGERAIYLFCPNGYAKTKLSNSFFERKFSMPVTTRNWNTVNALYRMVIEG